jgi:hypothetical protein
VVHVGRARRTGPLIVARRFRQNLGLVLGLAAGAAGLLLLLWPGQEALHVRGPMNTGHDDIDCEHCHQPAPGSLRQQLQANARHLLGLRGSAADFGLQRVGNAQCLACHDFPEERHPVFRFTEPRFERARLALHPETCVSCHVEHRGVRVTLPDNDYCRHCHGETRLKRDPLDVSHETLIDDGRWESCLGCHDFHGNHVMTTRRRLADVIPPERVAAYFRGGASPYSQTRRHQPREEPLR